MSTPVVAVTRLGMANCRRGRVSVPIWTIAVYRPVARQRDGIETYRRAVLVGRSRAGHRPSGRLMREAATYAESCSLPFRPHVRHGQRADA